MAVAAAAVLAFLLWTPRQHDTPFELRIAERTTAERTTAERAWADAVSPLPNMLASLAASEEPDALFDAPVNGLWLVAATKGPR